MFYRVRASEYIQKAAVKTAIQIKLEVSIAVVTEVAVFLKHVRLLPEA